MGHQEHVTGDKEAVVKGVVVNMAEHGTGTEEGGGVLVEEDAEVVNENRRVLVGPSNASRQESSGSILDSNNNNVGLADYKAECWQTLDDNERLRTKYFAVVIWAKTLLTLKYKCSRRLMVVRLIESVK
jgi:hypothetical protein